MCIVSNWVNEAQDLMAVTKYDDLLNSLIPSQHSSSAKRKIMTLTMWHCNDTGAATTLIPRGK